MLTFLADAPSQTAASASAGFWSTEFGHVVFGFMGFIAMLIAIAGLVRWAHTHISKGKGGVGHFVVALVIAVLFLSPALLTGALDTTGAVVRSGVDTGNQIVQQSTTGNTGTATTPTTAAPAVPTTVAP